MMEMTDKSRILADLARFVAASGSSEPLPARLCQACVVMLGGEGAALTLSYTKPERLTVCTTDDVSARLEDLQDVVGEGPGPEADRSGQIVVAQLGDHDDGHWPMFATVARETFGPLVLCAVPIRPITDVLGVLTLYQHSKDVPDPERAQFLGDAVGGALLQDREAYDAVGSGPWATRAEVHQATGMIVAQLGISAEDALALLRAHAYAHDMSLARVAGEVVERRIDFA